MPAMRSRSLRLVLLTALLAWPTTIGLAREWLYERDIAPILRTHCAGCHNDADREGEFSVETFAGLRQGGDKGTTLKPGDPEASLLIRLIEGRSRPAMPPQDEPRVPATEVALLRQWIAEGAPGPRRDESLLKHLVVPEVPAPSGRARPPRPWTSNWLDLARYADTSGYHFDGVRFMWLWRDWVIDAFNADKPFDQFAVEQLAGDLLPNPTVSQRVATGFVRNNMTNDEGGADPDE